MHLSTRPICRLPLGAGQDVKAIRTIALRYGKGFHGDTVARERMPCSHYLPVVLLFSLSYCRHTVETTLWYMLYIYEHTMFRPQRGILVQRKWESGQQASRGDFKGTSTPWSASRTWYMDSGTRT
jgi:hypothetical protein